MWVVLPVAAALDFVVSPAALSKCRIRRSRSTEKFAANEDFRLDGFTGHSRRRDALESAAVDRFGDSLRVTCEERRICKQDGQFAGPA